MAFLLLLLLALPLLISEPLAAQPPGTVDESFRPPVLDENFITYLGAYPDGRLIIAGPFTKANGHRRLGIARLHHDGQLDLSWEAPRIGYGVDGALLLRNGQVIVQPLATNVQPALRLNEDGSIDSTFQAGDLRGRPPFGIVLFELPNGRLGLQRRTARGDFEFSLLRSDGQVDESFAPLTSAQVILVTRSGRILLFIPEEEGSRFLNASGKPTGPLYKGFLSGVDDQDSPLVVTHNRVWPYYEQINAFHRYNPDGALDANFSPATPGRTVIASRVDLPRYGLMTGTVTPDAFGGYYCMVGGAMMSPQLLAHISSSGAFRVLRTNEAWGQVVLQGVDKLIVNTSNRPEQALVRLHTGILREAPPVILSQPLKAVGRLGELSRLSVHVEGYHLSYQWMLNGTNIPGANQRDLIRTVRLQDAGVYSLTASNGYGQVKSAPISFKVNIFGPGEQDHNFNAAVPANVRHIAVQHDGKILVAGEFPGVIRLFSDGSIDNSFNTPIAFPVAALVPAPGGQVFVGGALNGVTKLLTTGAVDEEFKSAVLGRVDELMPRQDGSLLVAGSLSYGGRAGQLARLRSNGELDGGYFFASEIPFLKAHLTSNGQLVMVTPGAVSVLADDWQRQTRFPLTKSFYVPGIFDQYPATITDVLSQTDGSLLIAGAFAEPLGGLARLRPNGMTDGTFAAAGLVDLSWLKAASALAESHDGKIVVAGGFRYSFTSTYEGPAPVGVFRLRSNGQLDAEFKPSAGTFHALAIEASGDILAAGDGTNRLIRLFGGDPGRRLRSPSSETTTYKAEFLSIEGVHYALQYSAKAEEPWTTVATGVGTGKTMKLEHVTAERGSSGFYSLQMTAP